MKSTQCVWFLSWVVCRIHDFHRITVQLKLEGTSGDCRVQPAWSKQGQLEQVTQVCVQSGFEYIHLQGWSLHHLSGQPLPVFDHSQNKKSCFLIFWWNNSYFLHVPFASGAFMNTMKNCLTVFSRVAADILMQWKLYERAQNSWLSKCKIYNVSFHHQQVGNKRLKVKNLCLVHRGNSQCASFGAVLFHLLRTVYMDRIQLLAFKSQSWPRVKQGKSQQQN